MSVDRAEVALAAAILGRPDPHDEAREELEAILGLQEVGVRVLRLTMTGQGARASAQILLSNGEEMIFDAMSDLANPTRLAVELAACSGALPVLKVTDARRVVALVRRVASRQRTASDDDLARDWGEGFLQLATDLAVDMADPRSRWERFCDLRDIDAGRLEGSGRVATLLDTDGSRFVRTGWFFPYARSREPGLSEGRIAQRMMRTGWTKRGSSGRIKATRRGFEGAIGWNFLIVPPGWLAADRDADSGSRVHAGSLVMRAREDDLSSRVEQGTGVNPGTPGIEREGS